MCLLLNIYLVVLILFILRCTFAVPFIGGILKKEVVCKSGRAITLHTRIAVDYVLVNLISITPPAKEKKMENLGSHNLACRPTRPT